jgi:hypothetical protein
VTSVKPRTSVSVVRMETAAMISGTTATNEPNMNARMISAPTAQRLLPARALHAVTALWRADLHAC